MTFRKGFFLKAQQQTKSKNLAGSKLPSASEPWSQTEWLTMSLCPLPRQGTPPRLYKPAQDSPHTREWRNAPWLGRQWDEEGSRPTAGPPVLPAGAPAEQPAHFSRLRRRGGKTEWVSRSHLPVYLSLLPGTLMHTPPPPFPFPLSPLTSVLHFLTFLLINKSNLADGLIQSDLQ